MANFAHTADIVNYALFQSGEPQDGTSDYATAVVDFVNRAYQSIWQGGGELDPNVNEAWWWLSTYNVLTVQPALTTGSISITNNAIGFTLTGAPTSSLQGYWFKSENHPDVFRISSHVSGEATGQFESVYTGTSNSGSSFKIFKTDYALATDVLYLSSPMFAYQDGRHEIDGISNESLLRRWPRNEITKGVPRNFAMIGERQVRFSHYGGATSGDLIKVEYPYIKQPADLTNATDSIPLIPQQYRKVLADWTVSYIQDAKSDDRAQSNAVLAQSGIRAMARDNQRRKDKMSGGRFSKIITRPNEEYPLRRRIVTSSNRILW